MWLLKACVHFVGTQLCPTVGHASNLHDQYETAISIRGVNVVRGAILCMQGFLSPGTDIRPIVPALEKIWADSLGRSMSDFNFRSVTSKFNELVYQYPIRIPERYALVIRSACHSPSLTAPSIFPTFPLYA